MVKKKKGGVRNTAKNIYVLAALILFNLMFVIHIWLGIVAGIAGLIIGAFALIVSGPVTLLVSLIYPFIENSWMVGYVSFGGIHPVAVAFLSIAIFCFGALWMVGNYYIVKYFYKVSEWYVKLNVSVFKDYGN